MTDLHSMITEELACLIGFNGHCGNFAIAYCRKFGGKLAYFYDEQDHMEHVICIHENKFVDASDSWNPSTCYDYYCDLWDLNYIDTYYEDGLRLTSEKDIFFRLRLTSEKRISLIMQLFQYILDRKPLTKIMKEIQTSFPLSLPIKSIDRRYPSKERLILSVKYEQ